MKDFVFFLVKAKKNTYASDGEGGETITSDGARKLSHEEKEFNYQDKYYGTNPFIGQEIVCKQGIPFWGMNYKGQTIGGINPKLIYEFLKECLSKVSEELPYRGPKEYSKNDFKYKNNVEGSVESFKGTEIIYYENKKVYELNYHGGTIKE